MVVVHDGQAEQTICALSTEHDLQMLGETSIEDEVEQGRLHRNDRNLRVVNRVHNGVKEVVAAERVVRVL